MYKVLFAIRHVPDLSEDFLLCSDDQLVTQPCEWVDFRPKYVKPFNPADPMWVKLRTSRWGKKLYSTLSKAAETRPDVYFYEPHIWSPVNKHLFVDMVAAIGGTHKAGAIRSQYYNFVPNPEPEPVYDHRFFCEASLEWSAEFNPPPKFVAYTDEAFQSEAFRRQLVMTLV